MWADVDTDLIGGRYRLDGELGSGGMGTVWRAYDELLARHVAVKEIRFPAHTSAQQHAELTARAMTEARAAAALTHPAIVAVHDVTMHDARPWIIMQLVPGRSLQEVVAQDGPLSPEETESLALRLLDALQTAHARGVTHRDVKPSNVLMPEGGASAMLTDFSIAKVMGDGTTNTGVPVGSAGYMAPERMLTGISGVEGDLFGLGATLFFALEGIGPFHRPDPMVAILAAAIEPHPRPQLAGHLTALLDALLTKDPRQRATLGQARLMLLAQAPPPALTSPPVESSAPAVADSAIVAGSGAPLPDGTGLTAPDRADPSAAGTTPVSGTTTPAQPAVGPTAGTQAAPAVAGAAGASDATPAPADSPGDATAQGVAPQGVARHGSGLAGAVSAAEVDDPPTVHVPSWSRVPSQTGFTRGRATVARPPAATETADELPPAEPQREPSRPRRKLLVAGVGLAVATALGGTAWLLRDAKSGRQTPSGGTPGPSSTPQPGKDVLVGHRDEIWAVAWAPDSQRLASASADFTVRLWTTNSDISTRVLTGHAGEVLSVAWSPDGKQVATGGADNCACIWDTQTGARVASLAHEQPVRSVSWSPDGKKLATGNNDRRVRIWDVASGSLSHTMVGHTSAALAVAWSPDGSAVASVGDLGDQAGYLLGTVIAARVWDPATGAMKLTVATGKRVTPAGRSNADNSRLLAGLRAPRARNSNSPATTSLAWSPDSALLATGNDASTTWLWDAQTGDQLKVLTGHTDIVTAVAFKPDEALLVSASADQTMLLWNLGSSTVLRTYKGHTGGVNTLAFSPDGKRLASGSADKTLRLWSAVA